MTNHTTFSVPNTVTNGLALFKAFFKIFREVDDDVQQ
jgi:hypothetical protein